MTARTSAIVVATLMLLPGCFAASASRHKSPEEASSASNNVAVETVSPSGDAGGKPSESPPSPTLAARWPNAVATPVAHVYRGQRISLDLKEADIHNVLRLIADVSQLNIAATDEVQGKVTLRVFDVPWDEALDIILRTLGLDSQQEGNFLRVSTVKHLREERQERHKELAAEVAIEPLRTAYLRLNYAKAKYMAEILGGQKAVATDPLLPVPSLPPSQVQDGILSERGTAFADETSNTLVVRDSERGIETARELVAQLDIQTPQVLIESRIVEATSDLGRDLGIQWGYDYQRTIANGHPTGSDFPNEIVVGGGGLGKGQSLPFIADFPAANVAPGMGSAVGVLLKGVDGIQNLEVRLTALEREGKAKVISRPRVVTLNNVPATIKSLTILRVKLPSTGALVQTGNSSSVSPSVATEKIETGIVLVVTPQVSADGFVLLDLFAKSSQADFTRTVDDIPTEISREANSHVLVRDGDTIVLGGIYRETISDQSSGVPFLKDIPVLGALFRSNGRNNRREDLLVFLTPHIWDPRRTNSPTIDDPWHRDDSGG